MSKGRLVTLFATIFAITIILVILGVLFNKTEFEKKQGLTGIYDVSVDGLIAYVFYEDGESIIYLNDHSGENVRIGHFNVDEEILDLNFSPDGSSFVYIVSNQDPEINLQSSLHLFDLETMTNEAILHDKSLITEVQFDPHNKDLLLYLRAQTFENYSPIARAKPHEFDLFNYDITNHNRERYTNLDKYAMSSLQVSSTEKTAFIQMDDDIDAKTADEMFTTQTKIFQVALDKENDFSVISPDNHDADIYDFALVPNKPEIIFQSASNFNSNDSLYEYELYYFNWESEEVIQLTSLRKSASKPVIGPNETVYFLVDNQFGKDFPEYHLYEMDMKGENITEILLEGN